MPTERRIRTAGRPSYGRPIAPRPKAKRTLSISITSTQRRVAGLIAAGLVLLIILGNVFAIKTITTNPSSAINLQSEAQKIVHSSWSLRNTITVSTGTVQSKLLAADATIKTVHVSRVWPSSLRIVATLKEPSLGWYSGNEGYLLDGDGTVIGALPAGSKLPVVYDDSNLPVTVGQAVVAGRFVDFVKQVAVQIPNTGLVPTKYEILDTTFDLYVTTSKGYKLKLDTTRPVGDEINDLKLVLTNLKTTGKTPTQSIDLRIPGRAYYK